MWYYKLNMHVCVVGMHILGHSSLDNSEKLFAEQLIADSIKQPQKNCQDIQAIAQLFFFVSWSIFYDNYTIRFNLPVGRRL